MSDFDEKIIERLKRLEREVERLQVKEQPVGAWASYAVSWTAVTTNPSIGYGTLAGRYVQMGKTIICVVSLTMGGTTTYGSGSWSFSLPKRAKSAGVRYLGTWNAYDAGADKSYAGNCEIWAGAAAIGAFSRDLSTGWLNSTTPFTWGSGDELRFQVIYEAA